MIRGLLRKNFFQNKLKEKYSLLICSYNSFLKPIKVSTLIKKKLSIKITSIEDYLTDNRWKKILKTEFETSYFKEIDQVLQNEYSSKTIYPPKELIFNAFNITRFTKVSF